MWVGLAVVLAAAAVLSFDALRGLALAIAIPEHLAWLLPISVDAGAAVSCAVWLGGRTHRQAARFAGRMTWALLAVTVAGNAAQLGMHANDITPPWWVAVIVGSIAPAVVGSTVHLIVLLVRRPVGDQPTGPIAGPTGAQAAVAGDVDEDIDDELAALLRQDQAGLDGPEPAGSDREPTGPTGEHDRGLDSTATDRDLVADMAKWAADRGRPISRDDAVKAYGIGAGRARKLRLACGWPRGADEEADRSGAVGTAGQ